MSINGKPYLRYHVPGDPSTSIWVPAGEPAPARHRADREGVSWAAVIIAVLTVAILSAAIIGAAALLGSTMADLPVGSVPSTIPGPVSHG